VVKLSLEKAGCDFVEICETDGYNCIWWKIIDKDLTVLVYGHYDVQPRPNGALDFSIWACNKTTDIHPEGAILLVVPVTIKGKCTCT
jgi:hypothetical protein